MLLFYLQFIESEEHRLLFEELYNNYRQKMYYEARSILRNNELAEDAVHMAFMGVATNMHALDGRSENDRRNYVLKAAKHAAFNIRDKEKRERGLVEELDYEPIADSVLEDLCTKESFEYVVNAISQLKEPYSTVLYCHFVMELDNREIASTLHRKSDAVRQQLSRGKRMLCSALQEVMSRV